MRDNVKTFHIGEIEGVRATLPLQFLVLKS